MYRFDDEQPKNTNILDWLKVAVLLGLGAYFAINVLSGAVTNYINQTFTWLSVLAAIIFTLLGVGALMNLTRPDDRIKRSGDHMPITWGALLIVAFPLALGVLIPSRPLGADAINGDISLSAIGGEGLSQARPADPLEWTVLDWLRAFNEVDDPTVFDGREAEVIGFIYSEPSFGDTSMVARFTVNCCVADATAIGLPVAPGDLEVPPQGTWVRVNGTFEAGTFRGQDVPVLQPTTLEAIPQPDHPYLYP